MAVPQLVPLQVRNGTLSIAAVERASAGTYTCHASSKEGTVTHTTRVLVQGKDRESLSPWEHRGSHGMVCFGSSCSHPLS